MKNTVRIHRNGGTKAVSPQSQIAPSAIVHTIADCYKAEADSLLDPELKAGIASFGLADRKYMADKFRRWTADLDRANTLLEWIENHNSGWFSRNQN